MNAQWKHRKAEEQLEPLLRGAAALDPDIVRVFPRPVKDILCASLAVSFESHRGLTARVVADVLADAYQVHDRDVLPEGDGAVAGFSFVRGSTAVVFSDPQYGEAFERFTVAHEAAHIVVEYLPRLSASKQTSLFGDEPATFYARRDPPAHLFVGEEGGAAPNSELRGDYARLRADQIAWQREVIANTCAAELLTPHRDVVRFVRELPRDADHHAEVRARYGLSRRASEVRLAELGLAQPVLGGTLFLVD